MFLLVAFYNSSIIVILDAFIRMYHVCVFPKALQQPLIANASICFLSAVYMFQLGQITHLSTVPVLSIMLPSTVFSLPSNKQFFSAIQILSSLQWVSVFVSFLPSLDINKLGKSSEWAYLCTFQGRLISSQLSPPPPPLHICMQMGRQSQANSVLNFLAMLKHAKNN